MSHMTRMLLTEGSTAAKAGDNADARRYLERLFNLDPDADEKVEAWLILSQISDDPQDKRRYLEYVIGVAPWEPRARRGIAILNGDLNPADIVDPSLPQPASPSEPQDVRTRRFVCPQCGGRMTFSPERDGLDCDYCGHHSDLLAALDDGVEEQEFVVALATAKGHREPVATRAFECAGCGASFLAAPAVLSLTCPYCGSSHVLESQRELIQPEGIIPLGVTEEEARAAMHAWLAKERLSDAQLGPLTGLYLPAWTFDVGGEVKWRGQPVRRSRQRKTITIWSTVEALIEPTPAASGGVPIFVNDVVIAASHALPAKVMAEITAFDLKQALPFDPSYLAGWPAEIYTIPAANASIPARQSAWERSRDRARGSIDGDYEPGSLRLSSHAVSILSYKLLLLPLWLARYRHGDRQYALVVNGQTGAARGERPPRPGWLGRLVDGLVG